jgi:hypothetical protein
MPQIYAATTDGYAAAAALGGTWADARDSNGSDLGRGNVRNNSIAAYSWAAFAIHTTSRGGYYQIVRSFFAFDTSGVTDKLAKATLNLRGSVNGTGDIIIVKATKPDLSTGLAVTDIDDITGFSTGASMAGNVTNYSAEVSSWSTSGYNSIPLLKDALSDITDNNVFVVAMVNYTYDYLNVAPSTAEEANGVYYADEAGTSNDPYIDYTEGFSNDIMGSDRDKNASVIGLEAKKINKFAGKSGA